MSLTMNVIIEGVIDGFWGLHESPGDSGDGGFDAVYPREGARQEMAGDADFLSRRRRAYLLADGDDFVNAKRPKLCAVSAADFGLFCFMGNHISFARVRMIGVYTRAAVHAASGPLTALQSAEQGLSPP